MKQAENWSGRIGFILATTGSAVGIGSIWKFPYEVGSNGGSAFLIFYLLGLLLVVLPLMFAEFAIGRRGRADSVTSIATVASAHGASRKWALAGALGVATAFLILSFYSVIGGWTIGYALDTALNGLPGADPRAVRTVYEQFLASPLRITVLHAVFMASIAVTVGRGIARGIELATTILMPFLAILLIALAAYSVVEGDVAAALRFFLELDTARLTARTALEALGLGFFSIGVGLGLMITYASYAGGDINLKEVALASVVADTAISFLAGIAVFPIVFAHNLDPASGPGLMFLTLPLGFARMPFGTVVAFAFFVLLFVAAFASAISLLEIIVAFLLRRLPWRRATVTAVAATACFVTGIATVLSFNLWQEWYPFSRLEGFRTATFFDVLDHVTSNILLPLGGLAISLFAGWAIPERLLVEELRLTQWAAAGLRIVLRYVAPIAIAAIALSSFR
jgi:NSS family neurotransmitter:Na+ symporter